MSIDICIYGEYVYGSYDASECRMSRMTTLIVLNLLGDATAGVATGVCCVLLPAYILNVILSLTYVCVCVLSHDVISKQTRR